MLTSCLDAFGEVGLYLQALDVSSYRVAVNASWRS
jgi:hypothetical protein